MSIRLLCKQTPRQPSNALFYFGKENKTGIAPTRRIAEKNLDLTVGMLVTVNWDGKMVEAEILALNDDVNVLNNKDLEWSAEHLPAVVSTESENDEEKENTEQAIEPPKKKVPCAKKTVEVQSTEKEAERPSDPYEQFLAEQKKRSREWKSTREAKRAKIQSIAPAVKKQNDTSNADCGRRQEDSVTLLHQQLPPRPAQGI